MYRMYGVRACLLRAYMYFILFLSRFHDVADGSAVFRPQLAVGV